MRRRFVCSSHLSSLQTPVEVPQCLGISLLVEGAQIRRPLSSRAKTFIRSHYEPLHKSRHGPQPHTCPSGKEKQSEDKEGYEKKKRTWVPVSTRKVTMERSVTLQPLMEKRRLRPALPSSSGPLPNPSACHHLHTPHTRTHHVHVRAQPTHTHAHRTQRHVLALNRLEPSLEILNLQPGLLYKDFYRQNTHSPLTHSVHMSHPVMRALHFFSVLQRQSTETYRNKGHAVFFRDCTSQREK